MIERARPSQKKIGKVRYQKREDAGFSPFSTREERVGTRKVVNRGLQACRKTDLNRRGGWGRPAHEHERKPRGSCGSKKGSVKGV